MNIFLAVLVRSVVFGAALLGYYLALPTLFPDDGGGANIGAGLIAFAAIMAASFAWSIIDGRLRGFATACAIWACVAAIVAIGWLVSLAVSEADASLSVTEHIVNDLGSLPFTAGLIIAPAVLGAVIGHALRPSQPA